MREKRSNLYLSIRKGRSISKIFRGDLVVPFDIFGSHSRTEGHHDVTTTAFMVRVLIFEDTLDLISQKVRNDN